MSTRDKASLGGCIALLLYIPVAALLAALTFGYAGHVLWGWFVLPVFVGAPALSFAQFYGLMLVAAALKPQMMSDEDDYKSVADQIVLGLLRLVIVPAALLFVGWLVRAVLL